ncbi:hypothetical protein PRK78_001769 [Emydomyces testavorans]|uniref:XRCC4 coiled-coil domain-containing protein n=1 Tax=Emydomyces testavorans TaxID=2070801 RepID=A0AAF0DD19_9EURO|nr:hypothetical protein PRK78_001769 [Emydomyces testavorans]
MVNEQILRIERSDSPEAFVLINVSKAGKSELDLRLIATEGENPYVGSGRLSASIDSLMLSQFPSSTRQAADTLMFSVKTSQISKLRAKNYRGSDEEWSGILSYIFNHNLDAIKSEDWTAGLETVATVKSVDDEDDDENNKEIIITLRKRIDSITQRLGSITLKQDDDQAIQLFDWAELAVTRANHLAQDILSLKAKYRDAENTINQLNSQLEELIQAKKEHEDQLIAKFAQLLNEKKLKIRNQQRLLATAKLDPAKDTLPKVTELETATAGKKSRKPAASRHSKRKAQADAPSDSESEDAFDTMDIDTTKNHEAANNQENEDQDQETATESDRQQQSTPEPLEDEETASEEEFPNASPDVPKGRAAAENKSNKQPVGLPMAPKSPCSPPPRRELPFARRGKTLKSAPVFERKQDENEIETESGDEL